MLQKLEENIAWAKEQQIPLAALNVTSHVAARAIVAAAEEVKMPVILQFDASQHESFVTLREIGPVLITLAKHSDVPVTVHLDHARDLEVIEYALQIGFNSIMFDGSFLSYEENLFWSKKVRNLTRAYGASLELTLAETKHTPSLLPNCWDEIGNTLYPSTYIRKNQVLAKMSLAGALAWQQLENDGVFEIHNKSLNNDSAQNTSSQHTTLQSDSEDFENKGYSAFDTAISKGHKLDEEDRLRFEKAYERIKLSVEPLEVALVKEFLEETAADLLAVSYCSNWQELADNNIPLAIHDVPSILLSDLRVYKRENVLKLNYYRPAANKAGKECFLWLTKMQQENNLRAMTAHEIVYKLRTLFQTHYHQFLSNLKTLSENETLSQN